MVNKDKYFQGQIQEGGDTGDSHVMVFRLKRLTGCQFFTSNFSTRDFL